LVERALGGGGDGAVGGAIEAFAVETHRRRDDEPFDGTFDQRFEEDGGAAIVDVGVARDFVHRLPDADACGEMKDGVDAVERAFDGGDIANVAGDELDVVIEIVGTALIGAVNLWIEIVENPDAITTAEEGISQMRSDEARTSGNQNCSAHFACFPECRWGTGLGYSG